MKIIILAHGKIKNGPEFKLISDYVSRFNKQFNSDFLSSLEISESNEAESRFYEKVSKMLDSKQPMVLLDRNGEQFDSEGITNFVIPSESNCSPFLSSKTIDCLLSNIFETLL